MKQHIAIEQINELDDIAKEKLKKWWKPAKGDYCILGLVKAPQEECITTIEGGGELITVDRGFNGMTISFDNVMFRKESLSPLLSIGQLIEFLNNCEETIVIAKLGDKWRIEYGWDIQQDTELCDALWKVVKYILQNEK